MRLQTFHYYQRVQEEEEGEDEEEERGGYVRYRVLPPEWAPRIHMIPSLLSLNYSRNCFLVFGIVSRIEIRRHSKQENTTAVKRF